jgi:hypothetical protein
MMSIDQVIMQILQSSCIGVNTEGPLGPPLGCNREDGPAMFTKLPER